MRIQEALQVLHTGLDSYIRLLAVLNGDIKGQPMIRAFIHLVGLYNEGRAPIIIRESLKNGSSPHCALCMIPGVLFDKSQRIVSCIVDNEHFRRNKLKSLAMQTRSQSKGPFQGGPFEYGPYAFYDLRNKYGLEVKVS